jgi:hypothetical protein
MRIIPSYRNLSIIVTVGFLVAAGAIALRGDQQDALAGAPKQPQSVVKDPLDKLLDNFADACAQLDIEKAVHLFVSPDETPAGKIRHANLAELRKDWKRAKDQGAKAGLSTKFKNAKKTIRTDMVIAGFGVSEKGETVHVEFEVALTGEGWKIVSMKYLGRE